MNFFENIMIAFGRRVYHFFFLVSAMLICKICVQHFFYSKQNFKCPICEVLKSVRKPLQVTISYTECLNNLFVEPFIKETGDHNNLKNKDWFSSFETIYWKFTFEITQLPKPICSQSKGNDKLYLSFNQLKIGYDC
jgi:hypothetical protein